jgi:hypothetical protein
VRQIVPVAPGTHQPSRSVLQESGTSPTSPRRFGSLMKEVKSPTNPGRLRAKRRPSACDKRHELLMGNPNGTVQGVGESSAAQSTQMDGS